MLYSGTDPELYITECTLGYDDEQDTMMNLPDDFNYDEFRN